MTGDSRPRFRVLSPVPERSYRFKLRRLHRLALTSGVFIIPATTPLSSKHDVLKCGKGVGLALSIEEQRYATPRHAPIQAPQGSQATVAQGASTCRGPTWRALAIWVGLTGRGGIAAATIESDRSTSLPVSVPTSGEGVQHGKAGQGRPPAHSAPGPLANNHEA